MDIANAFRLCAATVFDQIDPDHEDNRHGNCSAYQSRQQGADDHVVPATANHELTTLGRAISRVQSRNCSQLDDIDQAWRTSVP